MKIGNKNSYVDVFYCNSYSVVFFGIDINSIQTYKARVLLEVYEIHIFAILSRLNSLTINHTTIKYTAKYKICHLSQLSSTFCSISVPLPLIIRTICPSQSSYLNFSLLKNVPL